MVAGLPSSVGGESVSAIELPCSRIPFGDPQADRLIEGDLCHEGRTDPLAPRGGIDIQRVNLGLSASVIVARASERDEAAHRAALLSDQERALALLEVRRPRLRALVRCTPCRELQALLGCIPCRDVHLDDRRDISQRRGPDHHVSSLAGPPTE